MASEKAVQGLTWEDVKWLRDIAAEAKEGNEDLDIDLSGYQRTIDDDYALGLADRIATLLPPESVG